tara:strand:+ start:8172 stop:8381 length:210 start_codon:yes stop_codon:yes gene_type:complete
LRQQKKLDLFNKKELDKMNVEQRVENLMAEGKASRRRGWVMSEILKEFKDKKEQAKAKEYIIDKYGSTS